MVRGRGKAFEDLKTLSAWHAATTINHNGMMTRPVSIDDLLGRADVLDLTDPDAVQEVLAREAANDV